jgi:hypothetical protein
MALPFLSACPIAALMSSLFSGSVKSAKSSEGVSCFYPRKKILSVNYFPL